MKHNTLSLLCSSSTYPLVIESSPTESWELSCGCLACHLGQSAEHRAGQTCCCPLDGGSIHVLKVEARCVNVACHTTTDWCTHTLWGAWKMQQQVSCCNVNIKADCTHKLFYRFCSLNCRESHLVMPTNKAVNIIFIFTLQNCKYTWNGVPEMVLEPPDEMVDGVEHVSSIPESLRSDCHIFMLHWLTRHVRQQKLAWILFGSTEEIWNSEKKGECVIDV